jgi:ketosteroid isomerase-like protein
MNTDADTSVESYLMRNIGFGTFLICSALVFAAPQTISDAGAVTKILALENVWNQAEERKDTKALDSILDNAMVYVDYDGTLRTKAEFLTRVKATNSHPQQEVTESVSAHMFASTAVVTGVYVAKGTENGKAYVRRGRFTDTWAFKDGNWVCVVSQATPITR